MASIFFVIMFFFTLASTQFYQPTSAYSCLEGEKGMQVREEQTKLLLGKTGKVPDLPQSFAHPICARLIHQRS